MKKLTQSFKLATILKYGKLEQVEIGSKIPKYKFTSNDENIEHHIMETNNIFQFVDYMFCYIEKEYLIIHDKILSKLWNSMKHELVVTSEYKRLHYVGMFENDSVRCSITKYNKGIIKVECVLGVCYDISDELTDFINQENLI